MIGVLGGVGPQATMRFEEQFHASCQRLIAPQMNRGYPPLIVYYLRHPPFAMRDAHSPVLPLQPDLLNPADLFAEAAVRKALATT